MQPSVQVSRIKRYNPGEEQLTTEQTRQSLEDKPKRVTIFYETTNPTITSEEESSYLENNHLRLKRKNHELTQNSEKGQLATKFST